MFFLLAGLYIRTQNNPLPQLDTYISLAHIIHLFDHHTYGSQPVHDMGGYLGRKCNYLGCTTIRSWVGSLRNLADRDSS